MKSGRGGVSAIARPGVYAPYSTGQCSRGSLTPGLRLPSGLVSQRRIAYQVWRPRDKSSNLSILDFVTMEVTQVTLAQTVRNEEPAWAR